MVHPTLSATVLLAPIHHTSWLITALDLGGIFVGAISGAAAGIRRRLDLFGILALASVASCSGGIVRDLLIGAVPPAAITDGRYLPVALLAGILTFVAYRPVSRLRSPVQFFDAVALGAFAVAGAQKGLSYHIGMAWSVMLGVITAVGGGVARDVLLAQVPTVLRSEIYATAAAAGALVVVAGRALDLPPAWCAVGGAVLCTAVRCCAIVFRWNVQPHGKKAVRGRLRQGVPPDSG
jgi:uncharacterized membrane protein YeiH